MRGLEAQQTLDRHLQRVIRFRRCGLIPPAMMLWIKAEPAPPVVEMALDIFLAGIVEKHGAVSKLVLIGCDAEHIRCQHQGRLSLVSMELMYGLTPILAAAQVTLVLSDDKRNAVHQQDRIVAALLDALHAVLIGGCEVIEVLPRRIESDEVHGFGVLTGVQHYA